MKKNAVPFVSVLLKNAAEGQMKADALKCKWFFYQPQVPQKILDRYKK